jgi:GxxExxY protein
MTLLKTICRDVSMQLGRGYSERVYQEALTVSFYLRKMHYFKEFNIPIHLMGVQIGEMRADIVLPDRKTVIECKAIRSNLDPNHLPQLMKYMKALRYPNGLLVNFNQDMSSEPVEFIDVKLLDVERDVARDVARDDPRDTFLVIIGQEQVEIKM